MEKFFFFIFIVFINGIYRYITLELNDLRIFNLLKNYIIMYKKFCSIQKTQKKRRR